MKTRPRKEFRSVPLQKIDTSLKNERRRVAMVPPSLPPPPFNHLARSLHRPLFVRRTGLGHRESIVGVGKRRRKKKKSCCARQKPLAGSRVAARQIASYIRGVGTRAQGGANTSPGGKPWCGKRPYTSCIHTAKPRPLVSLPLSLGPFSDSPGK